MKCVILYFVLKVVFYGSAEWVKLPDINKETTVTESFYHQIRPFIKNVFNSDNHTKYKTTHIKKLTNIIGSSTLRSTTVEDTGFFQFTTKGLSTKKKIDSSEADDLYTTQSKLKVLGNSTLNEGDALGNIIHLNDKVMISSTTPAPKVEETAKENIILNQPFEWKTLVNIIKTVQGSLFANIPKALKKKTEYLKHIHDTILFNIEDRINALWPKKTKREARGYKEDDHHIDFPSAETALMTISFLTFAVFLIKLVMQVINVLKAKKAMYTPMVTATGRSFDYSTRGLDTETTARILQLMEDFQKH